MHRFRHEWASSQELTRAIASVPVVGRQCRDKVETLVQGRAVLLTELPDRAIARLDFEFPGAREILLRCREEARTQHGTCDSPHRYLPKSVIELALGPPLPWSQFASLSRRGSWLEGPHTARWDPVHGTRPVPPKPSLPVFWQPATKARSLLCPPPRARLPPRSILRGSPPKLAKGEPNPRGHFGKGSDVHHCTICIIYIYISIYVYTYNVNICINAVACKPCRAGRLHFPDVLFA